VVFFILIFNNLHFQIIASTKKSEGYKNQKTKYKKPKFNTKQKKPKKMQIEKKSGSLFCKRVNIKKQLIL